MQTTTRIPLEQRVNTKLGKLAGALTAMKLPTRIPTEAEYEAHERADLMATLRDVEAQSLADRREARKNWANALYDNTYYAPYPVQWTMV